MEITDRKISGKSSNTYTLQINYGSKTKSKVKLEYILNKTKVKTQHIKFCTMQLKFWRRGYLALSACFLKKGVLSVLSVYLMKVETEKQIKIKNVRRKEIRIL